jgi:hypothetical protein
MFAAIQAMCKGAYFPMQKFVQKVKKVFSRKKKEFPSDYTPEEIAIIREVRPYTMTGAARVHSLIQAVRYIVENNIAGDIVECGVWKGGSMLAVIRTLQLLKAPARLLWLYDTYEGMPEPSAEDIGRDGKPALEQFGQYRDGEPEKGSQWCRSPFEEVQSVLAATGYPQDMIRMIKGKVEDTIPGEMPQHISILRLDTDWYASTKHEMDHLYPVLARHGVMIVDDYGCWQGSRKAVDEYKLANKIPLLLQRIDLSARITVKP